MQVLVTMKDGQPSVISGPAKGVSLFLMSDTGGADRDSIVAQLGDIVFEPLF